MSWGEKLREKRYIGKNVTGRNVTGRNVSGRNGVPPRARSGILALKIKKGRKLNIVPLKRTFQGQHCHSLQSYDTECLISSCNKTN